MRLFWQGPEKYLKRSPPGETKWLACTISTVQYLDMLPNVRLETHGPSGILRASWGLKNREGRWDVWLADKHMAGKSGVAQDKFFAPLFLYTHASMQAVVEGLKIEALKNAGGVTTPELTQEGRALEWLKASFKVLTQAVESCQAERSKLLQASFFIGEQAPGTPWLFRAVVFNLDVTAAFDADGTLGVVIFDDKNLGSGSSRTPALEAKFKALKPPVVDEFIRLSSTVMKTCEARYWA